MTQWSVCGSLEWLNASANWPAQACRPAIPLVLLGSGLPCLLAPSPMIAFPMLPHLGACQVGLGLRTRPNILLLADAMVLTTLVSPTWVDLAHRPQACPHGLIEWQLMH